MFPPPTRANCCISAMKEMIESKVYQRGDKKKLKKRMDVERSRAEEAKKDYH